MCYQFGDREQDIKGRATCRLKITQEIASQRSKTQKPSKVDIGDIYHPYSDYSAVSIDEVCLSSIALSSELFVSKFST